MSRRNVVLLLTVVALIGGLTTGRELLFNLAYLLGLLLIVSFAWAWGNINWVHLSRSTRVRRTQVGRPLEERFTVRNTSVVPKLWLEVRDFSSLPGHYSSHVVHSLGSHRSYTWRVNTICQDRGRYQLGPLLLRSSDPFGLFPMQRELTPTTNLIVYPLTIDVHHFALPMGMLPGGDAVRRRTHYVTTNASGVRDYAPGDSFSRIHWPSSARRDRLIVKEFELDPLADIWLVPDMAGYGQVRPEKDGRPQPLEIGDIPAWVKIEEFKLPQSTEEYMVTVTASLAQYFLRRDRAVGMLAYGQAHEIVQPDRGERQLNRILETLAVLRASGRVTIQDVVHAESHLFARGTTVIVVTPTTNDAWAAAAKQLLRRGLRVVTVLIESSSFGGYISNAGMATLLQASGIPTYMVRYGDDLTAALSQSGPRSRYYSIA